MNEDELTAALNEDEEPKKEESTAPTPGQQQMPIIKGPDGKPIQLTPEQVAQIQKA